MEYKDGRLISDIIDKLKATSWYREESDNVTLTGTALARRLLANDFRQNARSAMEELLGRDIGESIQESSISPFRWRRIS